LKRVEEVMKSLQASEDAYLLPHEGRPELFKVHLPSPPPTHSIHFSFFDKKTIYKS
jgi:hypothetical protein